MSKNIITVLCVALALGACASDKVNIADTEKLATVTFQFKSENGKSVLTYWRKVADDGTRSDRFAVGIGQEKPFTGYVFPNYEADIVMLHSGTYYLESFQSPISGGDDKFCYSKKYVDHQFQDGWDSKNGVPYYLSFRVKAGQNLKLPMVEFDHDCNMKFKDVNKIFKVGSKVAK